MPIPSNGGHTSPWPMQFKRATLAKTLSVPWEQLVELRARDATAGARNSCWACAPNRYNRVDAVFGGFQHTAHNNLVALGDRRVAMALSARGRNEALASRPAHKPWLALDPSVR